MINDNYYIVGSTPISINVDYENFNFKMFPKSFLLLFNLYGKNLLYRQWKFFIIIYQIYRNWLIDIMETCYAIFCIIGLFRINIGVKRNSNSFVFSLKYMYVINNSYILL